MITDDPDGLGGEAAPDEGRARGTTSNRGGEAGDAGQDDRGDAGDAGQDRGGEAGDAGQDDGGEAGDSALDGGGEGRDAAPDRDAVIARIREAFRHTPYPGDAFLVGSTEGCEPEQEVGPFRGRDWRQVNARLLDDHSGALSFLSEGGFRYFLPAWLVADLRGELERADPTFHLTAGFHTTSIEIPAGERRFVRRGGGAVPLNPRRYGAATFEDHARFRLAAFCREEAAAIVDYLEYRRSRDTIGLDTPAIDAALESFWRQRARSAPTGADLTRYLEEEREYLEHLGVSFDEEGNVMSGEDLGVPLDDEENVS